MAYCKIHDYHFGLLNAHRTAWLQVCPKCKKEQEDRKRSEESSGEHWTERAKEQGFGQSSVDH